MFSSGNPKLFAVRHIHYPVNPSNVHFHTQVKKDSFYRQIVLSSQRDFAPVTRHFFAPSLDIIDAADFNYLIRWVIVTHILLDISVVNSHATCINANCSPLNGTIYRSYDLTRLGE